MLALYWWKFGFETRAVTSAIILGTLEGQEKVSWLTFSSDFWWTRSPGEDLKQDTHKFRSCRYTVKTTKSPPLTVLYKAPDICNYNPDEGLSECRI